MTVIHQPLSASHRRVGAEPRIKTDCGFLMCVFRFCKLVRRAAIMSGSDFPWPYSYLHPSRLPNDTVRISQRPCAKAFSPLIATMAISPVHLLFLRCCTFVLLIVQSVQAGSYRCDAEWMGRPKLQDCRILFSQLPFATTHGDGQLDATRLFIKPQFLTPPFSPVENPFPVNSMVQLPKIWRYSKLWKGRQC